MKIQFRTQGTGVYTTLADDSAGSYISGFIPRLSGLAQVTPLFRAEAPAVFARGNRTWDLRGIIEIDHGSASLAMEYIQTTPASIPDYCDVQVIQDSTTILYSPAVFVTFEPLLIGESSRIVYGWVCGALTLVAGP